MNNEPFAKRPSDINLKPNADLITDTYGVSFGKSTMKKIMNKNYDSNQNF